MALRRFQHDGSIDHGTHKRSADRWVCSPRGNIQAIYDFLRGKRSQSSQGVLAFSMNTLAGGELHPQLFTITHMPGLAALPAPAGFNDTFAKETLRRRRVHEHVDGAPAG